MSSSGRTSPVPAQRPPIAVWNPVRDVWEGGQTDLFTGLSDVWSETWPASGMTRSGVLSALPTSVPLISESACSLLATPQANLGSCRGSQPPQKRREGGHSVSLADQIEHLVP